MKNKLNKILYLSIGILIVVIIFVFLSINKNVIPVQDVGQNIDQTIISMEDTSAGSINADNSTSPMNYAQALAKYKDTRIQFNEMCQVIPKNVTYTNNSDIMIDNRASVDRTVKIDSVYNIKSYSFKIIKLSSETLPMKWLVDCDQSQNVATVSIQK